MPKPELHKRDHEHGGSDPIGIHYESVGDPGGGGSALPIFANTRPTFSFDPDDTPIVVPGTNFYSSDAAVFDSSGGQARILVPGMYVIGCQFKLGITGTLTYDTTVWLVLAYNDAIDSEPGYSIETPYLQGGLEEVRGTAYTFLAGSHSSHDVALQRLHPISLTASGTTFPVEIRPTFNTDSTDAIPSTISWLGLWGYRLGDPLDPSHSD